MHSNIVSLAHSLSQQILLISLGTLSHFIWNSNTLLQESSKQLSQMHLQKERNHKKSVIWLYIGTKNKLNSFIRYIRRNLEIRKSLSQLKGISFFLSNSLDRQRYAHIGLYPCQFRFGARNTRRSLYMKLTTPLKTKKLYKSARYIITEWSGHYALIKNLDLTWFR